MNLPNKITIWRMIGTFVFVILATIADRKVLLNIGASENNVDMIFFGLRYTGYVIMAICGFSDLLDGYIARKYNLCTTFGKLMDPLSDKIYVMVGFIIISHDGFMYPAIVLLILAREFAVTGLRGIAASRGKVIAASKGGKLKTIFQMSIVGYGGLFWIRVIPNVGIWNILWNIQLAFIVIFTIYTGIDYFWKSRHIYMEEC